MEELTEEQTLLSSRQKVVRRIRNYWTTVKPFSASHYRGVVMGIDMGHIMAQITVYILLQQSVKAGHVPYWTTDVIIISVALITALTTPYLSWLGFQRRRRTMLIWGLVAFFTIILISFTSYIHDDTDFCQSSILPSLSKPSNMRLILLIIIMVIVTIAGNATWCHGVAYIDENATDTATDYGILVCVKVLTYSVMYTFIADMMADGKVWLQTILVNVGFLINLPQLLKAPQERETRSVDGQGFFKSLGRVVSNKLVMSQIVSMALLLAGFWGSAYYRKDIVLTKYLFVEPESFMFAYTNILYCHFLVLVVCFTGMKFNKPIMAIFDKHSALKMPSFFAAALFAMYLVLWYFSCKKGTVAGLRAEEFAWPLCSRRCWCSHQVELNPVCVYDEMVTYLSPCHAGCTGMDDFNGISVVANCTCTGGKHAAVGACAEAACSVTRSLHTAVWLFMIIFLTLALMMQLLSILRSVDVRDRSVALGAAVSVVALMSVVAAHVTYSAVAYNTCAWSNEGVCKLYSSKFPDITYFMSSAFSLLSAILSLTAFLLVKKSAIV